jgi:hypothetical protein
MGMNRRAAIIPVLVLAVVACRGGSAEVEHDALLAVVDDQGELVLTAPDGETLTRLTDLGEVADVFQPVWSGANHVAYVEQSSFGGSLVVADVDGSVQRRVEFATAPFYLYPQPGSGGGADIVTLRNDPEGGLAAEVVHDDGSYSALDGAFPFFFTWTADGRVMAHSDEDFLGEVYPERQPLAVTPGPFAAPASRDNDVVYVRTSRSTSYLTMLSTSASVDLATLRGVAQLVVGGDRIAVRSIGVEEAAGSVEVMARQIASLPVNALSVVALDDGSSELVARGNILAFFWDPTGRRLLYLDVDEAMTRFTWHVWEDAAVTDYASFTPNPLWAATFLPFFDQYAQSMTLWAPDGSAFAFPGGIDGEDGIWVQRIGEPAPSLVSPGSWVAWGPRGA